MLPTRRAATLLLLLVSLGACSPSPTPPPTTQFTVEQAAEAYRSFSAAWTATYADKINAAATEADRDPANVAPYARRLADAYEAFRTGIGAIDVPTAATDAKEAEVDSTSAVIDLARQLEATPSDIAIKLELQAALARLAQASATTEAQLGISN